MQTHMLVIDLQAQLSTENNWSQICNNDKKFYSSICYFRFDITREYFVGEMLHQTYQLVSL